jgi:hypothetical protein
LTIFIKFERKVDMTVPLSSPKKLSSIPERRLALYGVAAGAAIAAGVSHTDATPITLDLTSLSLSTRTTPAGGSLFFDVNAASAAAAVGTTSFAGADFRISNNATFFNSAGVSGLGGNAIAAGSPSFIAARFNGSNSVGPGNAFNSSGKIDGPVFGNFSPGNTGYLGLRFTITGSDTHYAWANISVNSGDTVTLNLLSYESLADTSIHVPTSAAVPDQGSSILLLTIGAAGIAAFRGRQRKTA